MHIIFLNKNVEHDVCSVRNHMNTGKHVSCTEKNEVKWNTLLVVKVEASFREYQCKYLTDIITCFIHAGRFHLLVVWFHNLKRPMHFAQQAY